MKNTVRPLFPLTRTDFLLAILAFLSSLALYIRTLAPSLLYGDMAEFQTLSYTLGMTHPSGYPTQIMMGKLFTLLPFGEIAWRVNLMSAVFGALTVANLYLIVRLMGGWRTAALLASLGMATSVFFWRRVIVAESYGPAAGMLSLVWLCVLLWRRTGQAGWLFTAGLAGGLSLGIHSTVVMTGASALLYLLLTARKRSVWLSAAAGALLGLTLSLAAFFYLDYNDPPSSVYNTTYRVNLDVYGLTKEEFDTPLERFQAIFPASGGWRYYFSAAPQETRRRIGEYVNSFPRWQAGSILLGALALFGLRKQNQLRWREGLYALISFALIWTFAVSVEFSVYQEFYVPAAVFAYAWLGMGASALLDGAEWLMKREQAASPGRSGGLVHLLGLALLVLTAWNARADLRLAVQQGTTTFIQAEKIYPHDPQRAVKEGLRILSKVEDDAILFANWDRLYSYVYTAHILQGRTGIALHQALVLPVPGTTVKAYIDSQISNRPVYFTLEMPGLETYYNIEQVEPQLFRLTPKEP
ncbi:MAG: hypothetical protein Fur0043_23830 [Anaerolineales bacterium]